MYNLIHENKLFFFLSTHITFRFKSKKGNSFENNWLELGISSPTLLQNG